MMEPTLIPSGELAKRLGISRRSISRYAEAGQITPELVTPGGRYMWNEQAVREQLRKLAQQRRERH